VEKRIKIDISLTTILLIIAVLLGLALLWQVRAIVYALFIAFIINSAFRPFVDYLESKRIPRYLSIALIFILAFVLVTIATVTVVSETVKQFAQLAEELPVILGNVVDSIANIIVKLSHLLPFLDASAVNAENISQAMIANFESGSLDAFSGAIGTGLAGAVDVIVSILTVLGGMAVTVAISAYMLERKDNFYADLLLLFPKQKRLEYAELLKGIEAKLGAWLRGQFILMLLIGLLIWIGVSLPALFFPGYELHKFALPIAFIAAMLEVIPTVGPIVAALVAVIISIGSGSPFYTTAYTAIIFTAIQQLEAIYFVPKVMQKAVGIDPILTIVAIIASYVLLGIMGAFLVIPFIAAVQMFIEYGLQTQKKA
jgi:predicted PurR-regulated permease PerM